MRAADDSPDDRELLAALRRVAAELEEPLSGRNRDGPSEPLLARYRIVRRLGEGGMGIVYEAEQRSPRRTVALKVLRPGTATPRTLRRFEYEAEILARLDHPGIARVLESGSDDTGRGPQPWLAMERVEGLSLARWVAERRPERPARLELFAAICDAVHHAHQKGIVHRDLKPANVLVDPGGRPKVLDFGVARLAEGESGTTTLRTLAGELVGTLPYMSPEQVGGDPGAVDVRSDVYALGVILYELLSGRRPVEVDGLAVAAAARAIEDDEPTLLGALDPGLRGDLELVAAKALAKDRERRYDSAAALAEDVRRHLRFEPIAARPQSGLYQLGRFARRHRPLVGALALGVAALVAATVVSWRAAARARHAEGAAAEALGRAEFDARRARTAATFLASVIEQAHPGLAAGSDPSVRGVLEVAAQRVEAELGDESAVEAQVRTSLGRAFFGLGDVALAREHLERALALDEATFGPEHREVAHVLASLAMLENNLGDGARAERCAQRVLELHAKGAADALDAASCARVLGERAFSEGRYEEADERLREAIERFEAASRPAPVDAALARGSLGLVCGARGDSAQAEALHRTALAGLRQTLGSNPFTARELRALANLLAYRGELEEARRLAEEALAISRDLEPGNAAVLAATRKTLGLVLWKQGELQGGEELLREALEGRRALSGDGHASVAHVRVLLAQLLREKGELEESEALLRQVIGLEAEGVPGAASLVVVARRELVFLLEATERGEEALEVFARSLEGLRSVHAADDPRVLRAGVECAELAMRVGRFEVAERELLAARECLALDGADADLAARARAALAALYEAQGRAADAWRVRAEG